MQAMYGSRRNDLEMVASGAGEDPVLFLKSGKYAPVPPDAVEGTTAKEIKFQLKFKSPTTGIVMTDDAHFFVEIGDGAVTYRELLPRMPANYRTSPEREAYWLATMTPSTKSRIASGSGLSSATSGSAIAYGWHFNNSGMTAAIVTRSITTLTGPNFFDGAPTAIGGYTGTLFTLTFSYAKEGRSLTYSVSSGESGSYSPYPWVSVYTPAVGRAGMQVDLPSSAPPYFPPMGGGGGPLYCYFDRNDRLQIVRAGMPTFAKTPAESDYVKYDVSDPSSSYRLFRESFTAPSHAGSITYESRPDIYVVSGASITSSSGPGFSRSSEYRFDVTASTTFKLVAGSDFTDVSYNTGGTYNPDGSYVPVVRHPSFIYYFSTTEGRRTIRAVFNRGNQATPVLVIPYDDASAVLIGGRDFRRRELRAKSVNVGVARIESSISAPTNQLPETYRPNWPAPAVDGFSLSGPVPWRIANVLIYDSTPDAALSREPETGDNVDSATVVLDLHCAAGILPVCNYSASGDTAIAAAPYRELFERDISNNPVLQRVMKVNSSWFGAVRHDSLFPIGTTPQIGFAGGWPDVKDSPQAPIGWA